MTTNKGTARTSSRASRTSPRASRTSSRACEGSPKYSGDPSQARDDGCGAQDNVHKVSKQLPKNHFKLVSGLFLVVLGMFAFGFALVPIYNSLCKSLGLNGKIGGQAASYDSVVVEHSREVTVEFVANQTSAMPWLFYPKVKKMKIHPGEVAKLAFYAENQTDHRMTVQAIPSVTPGIAAKYIKKTECFCFTQQTLNGHEGMEMPLLFHLDLDLPAKVKTLTLSYTLFDITDRAN